MLKASHSRALGHIQLDRYTREQVSRLAASTLSRSLSTGSEIETQAERIGNYTHPRVYAASVSV